MPSDATLDFGERLMGALLGLDALYRVESGDPDGLAVVNMDTESRYRGEAFAAYVDAEERFAELRIEADALPEPDRRIYYGDLCDATSAFIRWRSRGSAFEDRLGGFLRVPAEPVPDADMDAMRAEMHDLLGRMGYSGDLASRCRAWESRTRVPPDEVAGVLEELMAEAWDRTEERLLEIPAPRSDGMKVETVSGVAYNARCDYRARTVQLNTDPTLTRPGLKHLTTHECYPGHYVQFKLRETLARRGQAPADVLLSLVNSASSCVFEGIADVGMDMIDWVDSDDDRLHALMNRYRAAIGTGAAWRLHALGWTSDAVADWLRGQSLVGGEGWIANRMAFISASARAVLIWSYWWGERVVRPAWRNAPDAHRREFVDYLFGRMHSNRSVAMFAPNGGS